MSDTAKKWSHADVCGDHAACEKNLRRAFRTPQICLTCERRPAIHAILDEGFYMLRCDECLVSSHGCPHALKSGEICADCFDFITIEVHAEHEANTVDLDRLRSLLNTPEIHDFAKAVVLGALHQRERWGSDHDAGKTDADWFWLIGYLAGKALHNPDGDREKRLHRIITIAAAACNWHAAIFASDCGVRHPDEAHRKLLHEGER